MKELLGLAAGYFNTQEMIESISHGDRVITTRALKARIDNSGLLLRNPEIPMFGLAAHFSICLQSFY